MADKKIKVKIDVETDVEPSIAQLKALKKQLRDTAAGSEEFAKLQQQINDTEDAIMCLTALCALLVASKYDKADEVWEELVVKEAMQNFDKHLKEVIDEES